MADVEINFGAAIPLGPMLGAAGVATDLPATLTPLPGIYMIVNRTTHCIYVGISHNIRSRFGPRQGTCYELGIHPVQLANVNAYIGIFRYRNTGTTGWTNLPLGHYNGHGPSNIAIDGHTYDFEHTAIKCIQYTNFLGTSGHATHTMTNTQLTGTWTNQHTVNPINFRIRAGGETFLNGRNAGQTWPA